MTERMGKWSDLWWRTLLTLHDLWEFYKGGDAKTQSIVVSWPFSDCMINP
jgi:hypothetical protein